jgi:GntR family transcriptional repressor for pyruvate dehydrogenase complex
MMRVLIADIVTDEIPAGEKLPREADLAEKFGVSRGVARECIRAMEERGLISVKHGKGATVNGSDLWNMFDPDVVGGMLDSPRSVEILQSYIEARRIIEVEAAGLAAKRARKGDLEKMADALARMEESVRRPNSSAAEDLFHEADVAFHQALFAATRNRPLGGLAEYIHAALLAARWPLARPQYRTERALPEHRAIYAAVAAGDVEAAKKAMTKHLKTIEGYLREHAASVSAANDAVR